MYHILNTLQTYGPGLEKFDLSGFPTNGNIYPVSYGVKIEDNADTWINDVLDMIDKDKNLLAQESMNFVLFDLFEASKDVVKSARAFQKKLQKKIYVVSCNQVLQNEDGIEFVFNDYWLRRMPACSLPIRYTPKKLYINLTRVARNHRCLLLEELAQQDLFSRGYNTISNLGFEYTDYLKRTPKSKLDKQTFNILDVADLKTENPNYYVPFKPCQKSFVYIATETLIDNQRMFFSEKVYKPIAIGMPFMTLGNPGTLQVLKNLGYKTFDNYFNEDYDKDIDIKERIKIIVDNLNLYKDKPDSELEKIRNQTKETCIHNLRRYKKQQKQQIGLEKLCQQL